MADGSPGLRILEEASAAALVVAPVGRVDSSTAGDLERRLLERLAEGERRVVIDLADVQYISSAGLRVLLLTLNKLRSAGGRLVLCSMGQSVREVFELAGFTTIFTIEASRGLAQARILEAATSRREERSLEHDDRLVRNLKSLLDVSKAMAAATDLDSLLAVILERATEVMEAERATLFIHDEETHTLWNRLSGSLTRGQLRIPMGTGIAGHVARTGQLLNVPDAYADPRFNPEVDRETGCRTRSILCPMFAHDRRLVGVVQVLNKVTHDVFTSDDEALLEALASHAALALDRARLVEAFVEKQRIEEGLHLAHEIQMAMLPGALPREPDFQLAAALRPAPIGGRGSLRFPSRRSPPLVPRGGRGKEGKGVAAALYMAVAATSFRASLQAERAALGGVFAGESGAVPQRRRRHVRDFVRGLPGPPHGEVEVANAGHNPPYQLGRHGVVTKLTEPRGVPLGVIEGYEYATRRFRLEPGDGLYLYTDGVTEALDDEGTRVLRPAARRLPGVLGQRERQRACRRLAPSAAELRRGGAAVRRHRDPGPAVSGAAEHFSRA